MADLHLAPHRQKAFVRVIVGKLGVANTSTEERMTAPLVERRERAPRLEVQVRVVGGEPGAPMRLTRYFRLTGRGLGELVAHAGRLEAGAAKGGFNTSHKKSERHHKSKPLASKAIWAGFIGGCP